VPDGSHKEEFMPSYTFNYFSGQSKPSETLTAESDDDFFTRVLPAWEQKTGHKHIDGTVISSIMERRKVPEPAQRFFAYKAEHPESIAEEQLTPLQQRMQSGGV
jgi:hypothetical protein